MRLEKSCSIPDMICVNIVLLTGLMNVWNSLSNSVISADITNTFKNRLDRLWQSRELKYDFRAQMTGTGNRSEM